MELPLLATVGKRVGDCSIIVAKPKRGFQDLPTPARQINVQVAYLCNNKFTSRYYPNFQYQ